MKNYIKITAIVMMLCFTGQLFALCPKDIKNSEVEGIYLTLSDFKNGKLTRPTDMQHKGDKIKLKQFFISPDIISIEKDSVSVFYKDSIFAIRLTNGKSYRFINRTPCLIADTSYLFIYTYKTVKTVYKQAGPRTRRSEIPITYYYFSNDNHNSTYLLSLANIRKYALNSDAIHLAVCKAFPNDEMLQQIDEKTGQFKVNEIIKQVITENNK